MRTITYKTLRDGLATRLGDDPALTIPASRQRQLARYLTKRVRQGWTAYRWPELTEVEERQFAEDWDSTDTYAAQDFVLWRGSYYQALRSSSNQEPVSEAGVVNASYWVAARYSWAAEEWISTGSYAAGDAVVYPTTGRTYVCHTATTSEVPSNASYWGEVTGLNPLVGFSQSGETAIGDVFEVWETDPRKTRRARTVNWWLSADGVQCEPGCPVRVWVQFRKAAPRFTASAYSASTAYAAGALVYDDATGECYEAAQASTGQAVTSSTYWTKQDVPRFLEEAAQTGAHADVLREEGQFDRAEAQEAEAQRLLVDEMEILQVQGEQQQRLEVAGR